MKADQGFSFCLQHVRHGICLGTCLVLLETGESEGNLGDNVAGQKMELRKALLTRSHLGEKGVYSAHRSQRQELKAAGHIISTVKKTEKSIRTGLRASFSSHTVEDLVPRDSTTYRGLGLPTSIYEQNNPHSLARRSPDPDNPSVKNLFPEDSGMCHFGRLKTNHDKHV